MAHRIQLRRDTEENWLKYNPILLEGEVGYEIDTRRRKIGDGICAYSDLPYVESSIAITDKMGYDETKVMSQKAITETLGKGILLDKRLIFNQDGSVTWEEI
jgi:hypothetical protein